MRSAVWIVVGLMACSNDDSVDPPDDEVLPDDVPRTCVATGMDGGGIERIEVELASADHPTLTKRTHDGVMNMRMTYAYDTGGRLTSEERDTSGPGGSGPDGVVDSVMSVEHSATSAIQRWGAPGGPTGETVTSILDAEERVVRYEAPMSLATFQLSAAGLIEEHHVEGFDPEFRAPFAYTLEYTYDANGRLLTRGELGDPASRVEFEHDITAERMIVSRIVGGVIRALYTYTYDAKGRTTRAEVDEDADGTGDWRVDIAYDNDGSRTVSGFRDGNPYRVFTMSAGCTYVVRTPELPVAWNRPEAQWQFFQPAIPNAYL